MLGPWEQRGEEGRAHIDRWGVYRVVYRLEQAPAGTAGPVPAEVCFLRVLCAPPSDPLSF